MGRGGGSGRERVSECAGERISVWEGKGERVEEREGGSVREGESVEREGD